MGVLDAQVHVGRETPGAYGTPVTPTRSFEIPGEGLSKLKRKQEYLQSMGARTGLNAVRADRRRAVNMGGEATIPFDVLNMGMGMIFRPSFGSAAIVQEGATAAWRQTFTVTSTGPWNESLTFQLGLPVVDPLAAVQPFTGHGGKVVGWEFMQKIGDGDAGLLRFDATFDFEDIDTSTALLAVPVYPAADFVYGWPDLVVTVDSTPVDVQEATVKGDNALKTDMRYLRGSTLKKQPRRKSVVEIEGSLTGDFENLTAYNRFVNGTIVPVVYTWTGPVIGGGFNHKLALAMPHCQFTGESPEGSLEDTPTQPLPFKVLTGTSGTMTVEYTSTDTAH